MGKNSDIGWTDHTFNPWWGCSKISPGCDHCYAEAWAKRTGYKWGPSAERRFFGEKHWRDPIAWNTAALLAGGRAHVFCASMGDLFEDRRELDGSRRRLFDLVEGTTRLDWLLLTKRPENAPHMLPARWLFVDWPSNAWIGVSAEDQERVDQRAPLLVGLPAPVRFLSIEPILGPIDLRPHMGAFDWVIAGGESGGKARDVDVRWLRALRDQCAELHVPFFMKQLGVQLARRSLPMWHEDPKGEDLQSLPRDLRVREWPASRAA